MLSIQEKDRLFVPSPDAPFLLLILPILKGTQKHIKPKSRMFVIMRGVENRLLKKTNSAGTCANIQTSYLTLAHMKVAVKRSRTLHYCRGTLTDIT